MARGLNKVMLIGNLGKTPIMSSMPNGNAVTTLSVATSDSWIDQQTKERRERTEWHRVVLFGKLAEVGVQYLVKGSKVYIEGNYRTREWEKDGQKRRTQEVICTDMQMLDSRERQGDNEAVEHQNRPVTQGQSEPYDDDIPF